MMTFAGAGHGWTVAFRAGEAYTAKVQPFLYLTRCDQRQAAPQVVGIASQIVPGQLFEEFTTVQLEFGTLITVTIAAFIQTLDELALIAPAIGRQGAAAIAADLVRIAAKMFSQTLLPSGIVTLRSVDHTGTAVEAATTD
jgi:hypothetical protein